MVLQTFWGEQGPLTDGSYYYDLPAGGYVLETSFRYNDSAVASVAALSVSFRVRPRTQREDSPDGAPREETVTAPAGAAPPGPPMFVPAHGRGRLYRGGVKGNAGGGRQPCWSSKSSWSSASRWTSCRCG